jgi:uncharacterized protein
VASPTTRLYVRVAPGAPRSTIVGRHGAGWKVRVAAAPERGRANDAVAELLASTLAVTRAQVRLLAGGASRDKTFIVHGLATADVEARLESVVRSPA